MFIQNFLCFILCTLPLLSSLGTLGKSIILSFLQHSFRYLYMLVRSPLSLHFSRLNWPSFLSLYSLEGCPSPFIIFLAFIGLSAAAPCSSRTGKPRTGHGILGAISPMLSTGEILSSTCWQHFA